MKFIGRYDHERRQGGDDQSQAVATYVDGELVEPLVDPDWRDRLARGEEEKLAGQTVNSVSEAAYGTRHSGLMDCGETGFQLPD